MLKRRWMALSAQQAPEESDGVYLYNAGDQCTDITGGWIIQGYQTGSPDYTCSLSPSLHLEKASQSGSNTITLGTANAIDLTGYTSIVIDYRMNVSATTGMSIIISTSQLVNSSSYSGAFGTNKRLIAIDGKAGSLEGVETLDLATLGIANTSKHIALCIGTWGTATGSITVNSIKLI